MRVVYIAGYGRSGSTVLDRAIGQHDGYVSLGEAWKFWSHVAYADQYCGCGLRFSQCEMWQRVRDVVPDLFDPVLAERYLRPARSRVPHPEDAAAAHRLRSGADRCGVPGGVPRRARSSVRRDSVGDRGRGTVDSSKNPVYGYLLSRVPRRRGRRCFISFATRGPWRTRGRGCAATPVRPRNV